MNRIFLFALWLGIATFPARAAETLPLAGEWRFALDRNDTGVTEKWFAKNLPDKIQLPGILQAQGYGDDIATNTPWVLTLGDAWWKLQSPELRERFSHPGEVKVPFLSQPPKHYLGAAWYQRDIEIPKNWNGKHFTLFLERVHWKSTVWLDKNELGSDISLSTPHEYELGIVSGSAAAPAAVRRAPAPDSVNDQAPSTEPATQKPTTRASSAAPGAGALPIEITPGKHRLTIRVDNRTQLPVAGHLLDSHSISDALGAAWNGIVGKIELRATPPVWISDVQVFPKPGFKSAKVRVQIGNQSGATKAVKLSFEGALQKPAELLRSGEWIGTELALNISPDGTNLETEIPLPQPLKPWDEFHPSSQIFHATLRVGDDVDNWALPGWGFGFRQITTRDKDILLNGVPINLRMTHFGGDFPLTGYPAMDVAAWKKIIQTCKDYGLNGIRFHSWCPPEAAFEAADELGFYLQPECGLWADFGNAPTREFLEAETARILAAYGNHPSFILLSPGNEPKNYSRYTPKWAATNYLSDPRRLYSAGTGWSDPSQIAPDGAQFATLVRYGDGQLRNSSGWFGNDFSDALKNVHIPVLAHEVGQWCAYPDFDVIKKFTGYLQPGNYEIFKYIAEQTGILDENKDFAQASGRFQLACYKEEIEANLRTPGLAGFQLLDLHDYLGQGTALIGVLDAFWESKGYASPEEFRKFCGPVVPLAWLKKRIFTTDEKLEADIGLANFGNKTLEKSYVMWVVEDKNGKKVRGGFVLGPLRDLPVGFKDKLYSFSTSLTNLPAPAEYKLIATRIIPPEDSTNDLKGGGYENDWNFWLYPAHVEDSKTSDVLVTHDWSEAETNLVAGKKVLFLPTAADLDPAKCPPMKNVSVFWNIQMTVRPPQNPRPRFDAFLGLFCETNHPALAEFPTEANCDWQWTPLINNVRAVNLTAAPRELKPIVWAIDDWNRNWKLGVIFEGNVGAGRLLVSAINLDDEHGGAGLKQLRRSLLDYMGAEKFQPAATLTLEQARQLWSHGAAATNEPARVFDPDLNDGSIPAPKKP